MYSKEIIKHLAGSLGLSVKDFESQFSDEKEVKVDIPAGPAKTFQTKEDFDTYNTNLLAPEYGRGVDDGKKNAEEVLVKTIKDAEGLELTGSQLTKDHLLTSLKKKFGGDNKALIAQFEDEKKSWIQKIADTEASFGTKLEEQQRIAKNLKLKTESLTGVKGKTKFDKFDAIDLVMKDVSVEKDAAGKEFIHYKGQPQKNDKLEPLSMAEVTNNIFIDKKWYEEEGGRGGGNRGGGGSGATDLYKEFVSEMADKGIGHGSATYQDELNKRMENKEFMKSVNESE